MTDYLLTVRPKVRTWFMASIIPYVFISMIIMLPSIVGVSFMLGEYNDAPLPLSSDEDKEFLSNTFGVVFYIHPVYSMGLLITSIFLLATHKEKKV